MMDGVVNLFTIHTIKVMQIDDCHCSSESTYYFNGTCSGRDVLDRYHSDQHPFKSEHDYYLERKVQAERKEERT